MISLLLLLPLLPPAGGVASTASGFAWKQDPGSVALLGANGKVVWQFHYAASQRMPYFHPVALPDSPALSWLSPPDHPWHYGMWFAWKYINHKNYWDFDPKTGQAEGVTQWSGVKITTRPDHSARIELDLRYHAAGDPQPVLKEHRILEVSAPANDGSYHFNWTLAFTAAGQKVELARTPIPGEPEGVAWGGYAGLTFRFAKSFTEWQAVNAEGIGGLDAHGKKSAACDFSGMIEGRAMGVAMVDHPQNLHAPSPWYVAMDPQVPFACLIAAPIFHQGFTLEPAGSVTLRYRVIIHPGRWDADRLRAESRRQDG